MKSNKGNHCNRFINELIVKYLRGKEHPFKQRIVSWFRSYLYNKRLIATTHSGFKMSLDLKDIIQKTIFFEQTWEPLLTNFLNLNLKADDVFYDVGCNVGYYSLLASTRSSEVIAFDPDPDNIVLLEQNIRINQSLNISSYTFGLDAVDGTRTFYRSSVHNNGLSGYNPRNVVASFDTELYSIDSLIQKLEFPTPTVIKLDTEGWEENILLGAKILLRTNPPRLIIFESDSDYRTALNHKANIEEILSQYEYAITAELRDELGINYVATLKSQK
ncbi:FkbM family methyltransferase [Pedobacter aquatilis]|uniref:FkbM family methyltransferase n=1 Tax=Pedobacter aquatilis TaxID=351343 RepID=UPI00292D0B87|nr:FkbM family methyltransferase [Pedobacter aquatilis]